MESGLTRTDKWIQGFAIGVGIFGVVLMVGFGILLMVGRHTVTADFDPSFTGQVGDFVGGIAGSLFALAAGLLFYLALSLQRKEFRNSLVELKLSRAALDAAATHQKNTLKVMREEKEFNVCYSASQDVVAEARQLFDGLQGIGVVPHYQWTANWSFQLLPVNLAMDNTRGLPRFHSLQPISVAFPHYDELYALNVRLYWLLHAIGKKRLASADSEFLQSGIAHWVRDVGMLTTEVTTSTLRAMDQLLLQSQDDLDRLLVNQDTLKSYRKEIEHLAGVKYRPWKEESFDEGF